MTLRLFLLAGALAIQPAAAQDRPAAALPSPDTFVAQPLGSD